MWYLILHQHAILSSYHFALGLRFHSINQTEILSWIICKVTALISMSMTQSYIPEDLQSGCEAHERGSPVLVMLLLCEQTLKWPPWSGQSSKGHSNTVWSVVVCISLCLSVLGSSLASVIDANTICFLAAQQHASLPPTVLMFMEDWWQGCACQLL